MAEDTDLKDRVLHLPQSSLAVPSTSGLPDLSVIKNENFASDNEDQQKTSTQKKVLDTVIKQTVSNSDLVVPKTEKSTLDLVQKPKSSKQKQANDVMVTFHDEDLTMTLDAGDMDISCLNEEIDLGTEIKISGLGDTLPLPEPPKRTPRKPKDRDRSKIVHSAVKSVIDLSKSLTKPKDRDKSKKVSSVDKKNAKKVESNIIKIGNVKVRDPIVKPSTEIPTINIDDDTEASDFEDNVLEAGEVIHDTETPFYGNRIILGGKSKTANQSILNERLFNSEVILENCAEKLERSNKYCQECKLLFSNSSALENHNAVKHASNSDSEVESDVESVEKVVPKAEVKIECRICCIVFSCYSNMCRHIRKKHGGLEKYRKLFPKETPSHKKTKHDNNADEIEEIENEPSKKKVDNFCSHCDKHFPSNDVLVKHLYTLLTPDSPTRDSDNNKSNEIRNDDELEPAVVATNDVDLEKIRQEVIKEAKSKLGIDNESEDDDPNSDDNVSDNVNETYTDIEAMTDEDVPNYQCPKCEMELTSQVELAKHELTHTNKEARNTENFTIEAENLNLKQIKRLTEKKINVSNKKIKKEKLYLKCHICSLYFNSSREVNIQNHMESHHGGQEYDRKLYPFKGYCQNCGSTDSDIRNFNQHIRLHLYRNKNSLYFKQKKKTSLKDVFEYKCMICEEIFDSNDDATSHMEKSHPDKPIVGNIKKINVLKINKHTLAVHQTIHNPPVPKSVLFKCDKCNLNFFTTFAAAIHLAKCPGPKHYWKCPECYNSFKTGHREMHEKQHLYSDKFKVYKVGDNNLNQRVLSKCPECAVHFPEVKFWSHYHDCGREPPDSSYCSQCDILVASRHKKSHQQAHNRIRTEEFIIIDYEVPGNSDMKRKGDEHEEATPAKKKKLHLETESENEDGQTQMLYCSSCKSYLSTMTAHQNSAHFENRCKNLPKKICNECGLLFTYRALFLHKTHHEQGFTLLDVAFYDLNFKQIDPPVPQFTRCNTCSILFIDTNEMEKHSCNETTSKNCDICKSDFSESCFNIHLKFHTYSKSKILEPFSRKTITQIQKMLILKQNKLFTLYQCVDCDVVVSDDKLKQHQKLMFECVTMKNIYKKCPKCKLTLNCEDYHDHIRKHDDENFSRRNMKVVPFDRHSDIIEVNKNVEKNKNAESVRPYIFYRCEACKQCLEEYKPSTRHSCTGSKVWCPICKINISAVRIKKHKFDHNLYPDMNSKSIRIIKINHYKPRELVKKRKKKSDDDYDDDDDDTSENSNTDAPIVVHPNNKKNHKTTLYKCEDCQINLLKETQNHKCDLTMKTKKCYQCKNYFLESDIEKHNEFHRYNPYNSDQIKIVFFRNKKNDPVNERANKTPTKKDKSTKIIKEPDALPKNDKQTPNTSKSTKGNASNKEIVDQIDTLYKCTCGLHFLTEKGIYDHFSGCCNKKAKKQKCTKCDLLFKPPVLFNHLVTHHAKNRTFKPKIVEISPTCHTERDLIFKCSKCDVHFLSKTLARNHDEACNGQSVEPCGVCGLQFDDTMMAYHRRRHHMTKIFLSDDFDVVVIGEKEVVEKTVNKKDISRNKDKVVIGEKNVVEKAVNKKEISRKVDKKVNSTVNSTEKDSDEEDYINKRIIYKCVPCDLYFFSKFIVRKHTNSGHKSLTSLKKYCEKCNRTFANYNEHVNRHHDLYNINPDDFEVREYSEQKSETPVLFGCRDCNIYCLTKDSLYKHVLLSEHKSRSPFQRCDKCDQLFIDAPQMRIHVNTHHTEQNLSFADFEIQKYPLTEEMDDDSEKYSRKMYKCMKCGICLMNERQNKNHKAVFVSCPPKNIVECKECGLTFYDMTLLEHTRYHHHVKKYKLNDFKIKSSGPVVASQKTTDLFPDRKIYKCKSCSVHFFKRKTCLKHVTKHDTEVPDENKRTCPRCNIVFHSGSLKMHRLHHHVKNKFRAIDLKVNEYDPDNLKKGSKIAYKYYTGCKSVVSVPKNKLM